MGIGVGQDGVDQQERYAWETEGPDMCRVRTPQSHNSDGGAQCRQQTDRPLRVVEGISRLQHLPS